MRHDHERLSKVVSHALRHEPWLYELEIDDEGWTSIDNLMRGIRNQVGGEVSRHDLVDMIESSTKRRHEIKADRIRALYGHSLAGRLIKTPAAPPNVLYHGTRPAIVPTIKSTGLLPMGRQYVHCSIDCATAKQVGRRKAKQPVILSIKAAEAHRDGVTFYQGNEQVWLADGIPPQFIEFPAGT